MSKNKRQIITVLVLILLLVAVSVGYVFLSKHQDKKEKEGEEKDITLNVSDAGDIQKLQYKSGDIDLSFSKEGDDWRYDEDKNFPVNTDYMDKMVSDMTTLTAAKLVTEECTDLKQYGLDTPQLVVKFSGTSGTEKTFAVGNESNIASGCYAYLDDTKKIYIVATELLGDFEYTKQQMMAVPAAPNIVASNVKSYQFIKGDKVVVDNKVKEGDSNATIDYSGLANIVFTGGVSYNNDTKMIKKCGLDKPQYTVKIKYNETVSGSDSDSGDTNETDSGDDSGNTDENSSGTADKKEKSLCLYIGDKTEDGSYYVRVKGTEGIYLLQDAAVQALLEIK